MTIYNLIPAKTESSRLPGKNTFRFMFGNKPLIAHTIHAVEKASIQPIVFTNEPGLSNSYGENLGNNYGAKIIKRSNRLSTLKTTMKETVSAFIKIMNLNDSDIILLTYLTCPFRTSRHINEAIGLFYKTTANSLQSISPVNYRPYGLMRKEGYKLICLQDQKDYYQKQNTPTLYKANGAIYIFRISELNKLNNQMFNKDTIGYELDEVEGLDIDTETDLMLAEKILEKRNGNELKAV